MIRPSSSLVLSSFSLVCWGGVTSSQTRRGLMHADFLLSSECFLQFLDFPLPHKERRATQFLLCVSECHSRVVFVAPSGPDFQFLLGSVKSKVNWSNRSLRSARLPESGLLRLLWWNNSNEICKRKILF